MEPMKPMKPMQPMKPMEFGVVSRWWPEDLGNPNSSGSQNDVHYAYFSRVRRLLIRQGNQIVTYDTGIHDIQGVSQVSDVEHAIFTGNRGPVYLSSLKRV